MKIYSQQRVGMVSEISSSRQAPAMLEETHAVLVDFHGKKEMLKIPREFADKLRGSADLATVTFTARIEVPDVSDRAQELLDSGNPVVSALLAISELQKAGL